MEVDQHPPPVQPEQDQVSIVIDEPEGLVSAEQQVQEHNEHDMQPQPILEQ